MGRASGRKKSRSAGAGRDEQADEADRYWTGNYSTCGCRRRKPHLICPKHGPAEAAETRRKLLAEDSNPILMGMLELAVPMWIDRLRPLPWTEIERRRERCADVLAFASPGVDIAGLASRATDGKKGGVAAAFNVMAEALAILSFCPGGVTFSGSHWEAAP